MRTIVIILACFEFIARVGTAQTRQPLSQSATPGIPNPVAGATDLTVDGVTGSVSSPSSLRQNATVRVVVQNVNPFLFQYRVQVESNTLTEPSPIDFFNLVFGLKLEKPVPAFASQNFPGHAATKGEAGRVDTTNLAGCNESVTGENRVNAMQAAGALVSDSQRLKGYQSELIKSIENINRASEIKDNNYRKLAHVVYDAGKPASEVKPAAENIYDLIRTFQDTLLRTSSSLERHAIQFIPDVATFAAKASQLAQKYPSCDRFASLASSAQELARDTLTLRQNQSMLEKKADEITDALSAFSQASDPSAYYITELLPNYDAPTNTTITVSRRRVSAPGGTAPVARPARAGDSPPPQGGDDAFRQFAQSRINIGGNPRFSIGAGIAVGFLPQQDFGVANVVIPSASGRKDSTATVAVAKESSDYRILPMFTLNTRVMNLNATHITLGIGMRRVANDNDLQYLVGLSQGFGGGRLLITAGGYAGHIQILRPGLSLGDRVPDEGGIQQSKWGTKAGVALTYRLY